MDGDRGEEGQEEEEVLRFIYLTNKEKKKKSILPVGPAAVCAHCTLPGLGSNKVAESARSRCRGFSLFFPYSKEMKRQAANVFDM